MRVPSCHAIFQLIWLAKFSRHAIRRKDVVLVFAPSVLKAKMPATSKNSLVRGLGEAHTLPRSMRNQPLRPSLRWGWSQSRQSPGAAHEGVAVPKNVSTALPGVAWDFSKISIFPRDRAIYDAPAITAAERAPFGHDFSRIAAYSPLEQPARENLLGRPGEDVSKPGDRYQREAEPGAADRSVAPAEPIKRVSLMSGPVIARQPQGEGASLPISTAYAEREREVEAISVGGTTYVLYQTKVRGGGSSAWLANNPGNLDYTADTVAWGGYEDKKLVWGQHRFAIFPNEEQGLAAVRAFLRKHQTIRNITLMMNLFAPASDIGNKPNKYAEDVAARLGPPVTVNTLVRDLSDDQIRIFAEVIKEKEGWTPGPVNDVPRGDPSLPEAIRNR